MLCACRILARLPNYNFRTMNLQKFEFLKIYATTPESEPQRKEPNEVVDGLNYYEKVKNAAQWSELYHFEGTLIYANNSLVDGWSVAQIILEQTKSLKPLVAVNPVYIHPYSLAKNIASLSFMYGRRVDINWIAGGFQNDLKSLGDHTPHDERYDRLLDYAQLIKGLLSDQTNLFSHTGKYYQVDKVKLLPKIPQNMIPLELISGTSEAGLAAATQLGAIKVKYAKPLKDYQGVEPDTNYNLGVRFGIIARNTEEEAWQTANARFPDDKMGSMTHKLAANTSDSKWHKEISNLKEEDQNDVYWLKPFHTYKTFCPYLVGTHEQVATELAGYVKLGHTSIILDIMPDKVDYEHCYTVFKKVEELTKAQVNKYI